MSSMKRIIRIYKDGNMCHNKNNIIYICNADA
jgi:hypothetical protein